MNQVLETTRGERHRPARVTFGPKEWLTIAGIAITQLIAAGGWAIKINDRVTRTEERIEANSKVVERIDLKLDRIDDSLRNLGRADK